MHFFVDYFGWFLIGATFVVIFFLKWLRGDTQFITAKYETEKRCNFPVENRREIIQKALENSKFKEIYFEESNFSFYAKTRVSMSSWSELIEVKVADSNNETIVSFLSVCFLITQIYSWGKNRRNAKRFFNELNKLLERI